MDEINEQPSLPAGGAPNWAFGAKDESSAPHADRPMIPPSAWDQADSPAPPAPATPASRPVAPIRRPRAHSIARIGPTSSLRRNSR